MWEIFLFKNIGENKVWRLISDLLLFYRKTLYKVKISSSTLVLINIGRPQLGHAIKANCITFQTVDPEICSFVIFLEKGLGSFSTTFYIWFFKKNISHVIFY